LYGCRDAALQIDSTQERQLPVNRLYLSMAETSALSRVRQAIQDGDLASLRGILATVSIEDLEAEVVNVRFPGVEVDLKQIPQPTSAIGPF